jgi:hypothetical protein
MPAGVLVSGGLVFWATCYPEGMRLLTGKASRRACRYAASTAVASTSRRWRHGLHGKHDRVLTYAGLTFRFHSDTIVIGEPLQVLKVADYAIM